MIQYYLKTISGGLQDISGRRGLNNGYALLKENTV